MRQHIAIIGSGAIGGYMAAQAHFAGNHVMLCVRTPFEQLIYEDRTGKQEIPATLYTDPKQVSPVDWVFLTTKIESTDSTQPWLEKLVDEQTTVVVIQNGIDHCQRVEPLVPKATVLPAIIYVSSERSAPGHIHFYESHQMAVPAGKIGEKLTLLLKGSDMEISLHTDFQATVWRKLFGNLTVNSLTALTLRRVEVMQEPDVYRLAKQMLTEALAVAKAEGVKVTELDVQQMLNHFARLDPRQGSSMMYDRLAGQSMEHEAIIGTVVRLAQKHRLPVPRNEVILTLLRAVNGRQLK